MWPSKMLHILLFNFLLSFTLVACTMPKPQDRTDAPEDNATFIVDKAEAGVTEQKAHAKISLPIAKVYNFRVCLKESKLQKPVLYHDFELSQGESTQTLKSDGNGCVKWIETLEYNHLAKAEWVQVTRTLKANGLQQGQRKVSFALNPWEDLGYSLLEKQMTGLVPFEQAAAVLKGKTQKGLWIDDVRISIEEKRIASEGSVLHFEVRSQPAFAVTKTANRQVLEPITQGQFDAELVLINSVSENQKEVRRVISNPIKVSGKLSGNTLLFESDVTLAPNTRAGQIQLGMKVSVVGGPEGLRAFHGVYGIAEYDQIKGSFFARLKSFFQDAQSPKTIDDYVTDKNSPATLNASNDPKSSTDTSSGAYQKAQVEVAPLKFEAIGFRQKTNLSREKVFSVTACLRDPIDGKPLRAQSFDLVKANGSKETLRSNVEGCITWEDSAAYQLLDQECWISRSLQIANANLGMNQTLNLLVNPWAEGSGGLRDQRQIGKQENLCASGKARVILTNYSFDKKELKYPIDSYLNIKVQKEGILRLQAQLKRPSLLDGSGFELAPLPAGRYLLRWAVTDIGVRDLKQAAGRIFQTGEKWVEIDSAGLIAGSLTLESANLKSFGNTNALFFEISPEDKTSNLDITTYRGTIVLSNNNDGSTLEPFNSEVTSETWIQKLASQFRADEKSRTVDLPKRASKEFLAERENLELLNLSQDKESEAFRQMLKAPVGWIANTFSQKAKDGLSIAELRSSVQKGKVLQELSSRLCHLWFQERFSKPDATLGGKTLIAQQMLAAQRITNQCVKVVKEHPENFFDVHYRYFLKNAEKVQDLSAEVRDLSVNASYTLSRSHDESTTRTSSFDLSAGASTSKWMSPFSIGGGFRYQIALSNSNRHSMANSSVLQTGESLTLEKLNFRIRASAVEKCAVIRLNSELLDSQKSSLQSMMTKGLPAEKVLQVFTRGYMLCEGSFQSRNVTVNESYYILNQRTGYAQAVDTASEMGRPLFMVVRGEVDYRRLMKVLGHSLGIPKEAELQFQAQTSSGPSHVVPTFMQGIPGYPSQYLADQ